MIGQVADRREGALFDSGLQTVPRLRPRTVDREVLLVVPTLAHAAVRRRGDVGPALVVDLAPGGATPYADVVLLALLVPVPPGDRGRIGIQSRDDAEIPARCRRIQGVRASGVIRRLDQTRRPGGAAVVDVEATVAAGDVQRLIPLVVVQDRYHRGVPPAVRSEARQLETGAQAR